MSSEPGRTGENTAMVRLVGPGKSTIGAFLAERLEVAFLDLDRRFTGGVGDISEYIGRHGYDAYARENVETYCSLFRGDIRPGVVALSSGFMTYAHHVHPDYLSVCRDRSSAKEEAVIRSRFEIYMAVPARKIETMRPIATAVDEIVAIKNSASRKSVAPSRAQ